MDYLLFVVITLCFLFSLIWISMVATCTQSITSFLWIDFSLFISSRAMNWRSLFFTLSSSLYLWKVHILSQSLFTKMFPFIVGSLPVLYLESTVSSHLFIFKSLRSNFLVITQFLSEKLSIFYDSALFGLLCCICLDQFYQFFFSL